MTLVKSLLLGGAAGLVAVSGASAADLAVTKPAPAEYVRVCSAEGAGFFYIPGTETCLSISGRVRFDVKFTDDSNGALPGETFGYDFETTGLIKFDTRTATSLGTLRGYAEIGLNDDAANSVTAGDLFISLGGFTIGRLGSLYGFDDPIYAKQDNTEQVQYLATFGSGFYAGLAVEDVAAVGGRRAPNSDGFSQEVGGVAAIGYNNGGVHVRLAGFANTVDQFGVQLQAQASFGSGTTVFAAADYEDLGAVDGFSVTLKLSQAFSDQFSANIGVGYKDVGAGDSFKVVAGADYTLVPGFVIGPEVVYEDMGAVDSITGRLRFQRNF